MNSDAATSLGQILVIDDEPEILEVIKAALTPEGYVVHTAVSPEEGLVFYEQHVNEINLVLLDFLMPDMSGDLVFECLQNINPDVRVALLTGCDDRVARKMFEHGLRGYIQKPFYLADLKAEVKRHLEAD